MSLMAPKQSCTKIRLMTARFSTAELAECARRELARRRREFPRMVARAILNKAEAEKAITFTDG
jgi:hypothetical protein